MLLPRQGIQRLVFCLHPSGKSHDLCVLAFYITTVDWFGEESAACLIAKALPPTFKNTCQTLKALWDWLKKYKKNTCNNFYSWSPFYFLQLLMWLIQANWCFFMEWQCLICSVPSQCCSSNSVLQGKVCRTEKKHGKMSPKADT